jgi:hypothetical protein
VNVRHWAASYPKYMGWAHLFNSFGTMECSGIIVIKVLITLNKLHHEWCQCFRQAAKQ